MALWRIPRATRLLDDRRHQLFEILAQAPLNGRRVIVAGEPDYTDWKFVYVALTKLHLTRGIAELIERGRPGGVDYFARAWAHQHAVGHTVISDESKMWDAQPHGIVAFPCSPLTQIFIDAARVRGVRIWHPTERNCR
jgi:hypothetical protein